MYETSLEYVLRNVKAKLHRFITSYLPREHNDLTPDIFILSS